MPIDASEHKERLKAIVADPWTWRPSVNDVKAIRWALLRVGSLEQVVGDMLPACKALINILDNPDLGSSSTALVEVAEDIRVVVKRATDQLPLSAG